MSEMDSMSEKNEDLAATSSMRALIAGLPEEERIVLTLFYLKTESIDAIATRLAVPSRAVESVLISGRTRLLASLGLGVVSSASEVRAETSSEAQSHAQESKSEE